MRFHKKKKTFYDELCAGLLVVSSTQRSTSASMLRNCQDQDVL
jgi:hypothetical protein